HLSRASQEVVRLLERPEAQAFLRMDEFGRFVTVLVYLPRDRYNTANRLRVQQMLEDAFEGELADYATRVGDGPLAQLHFVIRLPKDRPAPQVTEEELQRRLAEVTRTWTESLTEAVAAHVDEGETGDLVARFGGA